MKRMKDAGNKISKMKYMSAERARKIKCEYVVKIT